MPSIPFADNFLAGSLLTILMPLGLLIALGVWYHLAIRRFRGETPASPSSRRPPAPASPPPEPPAGPGGTPADSSGSTS